jgi:DNA-binding transcriptional LysR family regulator
MDWSDLRLVLALLTEGNLKAAARSLELDYSTVWRRVQRLEAEVGGRLYVRLHGHVQPTTLGRQLADRTREIERLLVSARALGTGVQHAVGELHVATADMLLGPIVLPILRRLGVEAPDLRLSLEVSPESRNVGKLEVDAAIRLGDSPNESVVEVSLGHLGFGAYALPELALRWQDQEISTWPVLRFQRRWNSFPTMRWLAVQAPAAHSRSEFDTMMSMAEATEAGLGIGLLPHGVAVRSGRLVPLRLPVPIEPARLSLLYHPDMRGDGRIRALVTAASREARERRHLLLHGSAPPKPWPRQSNNGGGVTGRRRRSTEDSA